MIWDLGRFVFRPTVIWKSFCKVIELLGIDFRLQFFADIHFIMLNKKVLIRERNRHTACCPILGGEGGTPSWVPPTPYLARGISHPWTGGTPYWVTPQPGQDGGYPVWGTGVGCLPGKGPGTSHWGTPLKDMGPVEVLWDGNGVPPPRCGQTENTTFPILRMRAVMKPSDLSESTVVWKCMSRRVLSSKQLTNSTIWRYYWNCG